MQSGDAQSHGGSGVPIGGRELHRRTLSLVAGGWPFVNIGIAGPYERLDIASHIACCIIVERCGRKELGQRNVASKLTFAAQAFAQDTQRD